MQDEPSFPIIPLRLLGRPFGAQALEAVRQEITLADPNHRSEIARRVCLRLNWRNRGGHLSLMSARVALLRLHAQGLICLPAPRCRNGNQTRQIRPAPLILPQQPIQSCLQQVKPVRLEPVQNKSQSGLWNTLMASYHYLGHHDLPGAQIRYLIYGNTCLLGGIGFGAAAWHLAPRDHWIGWTSAQRQRSLDLVLNNARFLILPWVEVKNLASHILAQCSRRLPEDFQKRYGWRPALLETFVGPQYRGTCYRAANWTYLGLTQGRGKKGAHNEKGSTQVAVKQVWAFPLVRNFRQILCTQGVAP